MAIAIAAGTVVTLLAFLPVVVRRAAENEDVQQACRLAPAIESELCNLARWDGLEALAASLPETNSSAGAILFTAEHRGHRVRRKEEGSRGDYFQVEIHRLAASHLSFEPGDQCLAVAVRIHWARSAAPGVVVPRRHVSFTLMVKP